MNIRPFAPSSQKPGYFQKKKTGFEVYAFSQSPFLAPTILNHNSKKKREPPHIQNKDKIKGIQNKVSAFSLLCTSLTCYKKKKSHQKRWVVGRGSKNYKNCKLKDLPLSPTNSQPDPSKRLPLRPQYHRSTTPIHSPTLHLLLHQVT